MLADSEHDLGNAVPPRLGCQPRDEWSVEQAAEHRDEHDEPDPQRRDVRVGGVPRGAVVAVAGEELRQPEDEVAKRDRAGARARADGDGEREPQLTALAGRGYVHGRYFTV